MMPQFRQTAAGFPGALAEIAQFIAEVEAALAEFQAAMAEVPRMILESLPSLPFSERRATEISEDTEEERRRGATCSRRQPD